MAEKVKNKEEEVKELIRSAVRLATARRSRGALMVSVPTLLKQVQLLYPFNIDTEMTEFIKSEIAKNYKVAKIKRDGEEIEVVLLYNNMDEVLEAYANGRIDTIVKVVDTSLDWL
jgi:hypothetical protein